MTDDATTFAAGATRVLAPRLGWNPDMSDPSDPKLRRGTRVNSRAAAELAHDPQGFNLLVSRLCSFFLLLYRCIYLDQWHTLYAFACAYHDTYLSGRYTFRRATTCWTWLSTKLPRKASTLNSWMNSAKACKQELQATVVDACKIKLLLQVIRRRRMCQLRHC